MKLSDTLKIGDYILRTSADGHEVMLRVNRIHPLYIILSYDLNLTMSPTKRWVDQNCKLLGSVSTPVPTPLLSTTLVPGMQIYYAHCVLEFKGKRINTYGNITWYDFIESTTNVQSTLSEQQVNRDCTLFPPVAQPLLSKRRGYQAPPFILGGEITNTSANIEWTPPKEDKPKIVHSVCRQCGTKGSHNIVNHKEYYWCFVCRDEC